MLRWISDAREGVGSYRLGVDRMRERERKRGSEYEADSLLGERGLSGVTGRMSGSPSPVIPRYLRRGPPRLARGRIAGLHNKS